MKRARVVAPAVVVVIAAALWFTLGRNGSRSTGLVASGTVEATEAALGFQVGGRILTVTPREGDRVSAGSELAALDVAELEARHAQMVAQRDAARSLLSELERGARTEEIAQVRAAVTGAEQRATDARRDAERVERLFQGGAVSQEAYDKARTAFAVAESQLEQAREQLQLVETGPRRERVSAQRAAVAQADAGVRQVNALLAGAVITAPFSGTVTVRGREPGEAVAPGAPVLTLVNLDDRWVRIYVREDHLGRLRLGQTVSIRSDTYPDKRYAGTIAFISSEAEFTPRNVQTTEERVKLVYAVKVRITGDPGQELKPGMPADVALTPDDG
jgi:HlyD family secretion protein